MDGISSLTGREAEVLALIARGSSKKKVAMILGISAHTVAAHLKSIYRKLDVHTAAAAVMRGMQLQLQFAENQPRAEAATPPW
jgi:DNA-binding CsgD family transcriptional regulator